MAPGVRADHHKSERVFELRIYQPHEGEMQALLTRFRDHTCGIFERLGIENVAYWVETEPAAGEEPKLYYVIAHPSRQAAKDAWAKVMVDDEWKAAYAESIQGGRLVVKVDSIFMAPTDFSAIK
ncbi:MAG: NIPSNAP family protein [Candidatus Synoicihabitans palmerolidicus]|nr:NIPSNAP family protein [Candidatus Synoicihabitans palmerolidicus]